MHDVIVGRDDGNVEIYSYDDKSSVPTLRFEYKLGESLTGLEAAYITNPLKQEILLSTYSGKVLALVDNSSKGAGVK